ncbi:hypothetical protein MARHY1884 [Marinobacter nauticus ATCC 49840]|nr:hypothetical protein MARHY1884 [Marinobacter nauticus ATCC 49840]
MFEKFRRKSAAARLQEEQLYEQVLQELSRGEKRAGLWAKALSNCDGLEQKAGCRSITDSLFHLSRNLI